MLGDKADEPLAAARDDAVDKGVEPQKDLERRAVRRRDELHGVGRKCRLRERRGDEDAERRVGLEYLAAAPQDRGVAALQAEDGAVDGDVRARLEDHADDADRDAYLPEPEAVRPDGVLEDLAEGVGEGGHLPDRFGEVRQPRPRQGQAVEFRVREAAGLRRRDVRLVRGDKRSVGGVDPRRERQERRVPRLRPRDGQRQRGRAGAHGDRCDEGFKVLGHEGPLSRRCAPSAKEISGSGRPGDQSKICPLLKRQTETAMTSEVISAR